MNAKTGNIYEIESAEQQAEIEARLRTRLTDLTPKEYQHLITLPEAERAEALALSRYIAQRKKLRAKCGAEVQNAFRNGYKAAVRDNQ